MSSICAMILTIISGVIVFFICEFFRELWLVPLHRFHTLKGEILCALDFYEQFYQSPVNKGYLGEEQGKPYTLAVNEFRQLASNLRGLAETMIIYVRIPSKHHLLNASDKLIDLAKSIYKKENKEDCSAQVEESNKMVLVIKKELGIIKEES